MVEGEGVGVIDRFAEYRGGQPLRAAADQGAGLLKGESAGVSERAQRPVDVGPDIGQRIDQCAVEVEERRPGGALTHRSHRRVFGRETTLADSLEFVDS